MILWHRIRGNIYDLQQAIVASMAGKFHRVSLGSSSVRGLSAGKIGIVWMSGDPGSDLPVCPAAVAVDEHRYAIRWHKRSAKCCFGMSTVCTAFRMIYHVLLWYRASWHRALSIGFRFVSKIPGKRARSWQCYMIFPFIFCL